MLAHLHLKLKLRLTKTVPRRYDMKKLMSRNDLVNDFEVKLGEAFAPLLDLEHTTYRTTKNGRL